VSDKLSFAQSAVISSLLANQSVTVSERAKRAAVPRRTFERIASRSYADQTVYDSYLPDFRLAALSSARLLLTQPFQEDLRPTVEALRNDPTCVLLWTWPETLFAVFVEKPSGKKTGSASCNGAGGPRATDFLFDISRSAAPVFFDYEGVWSRIADVGATLEYPRPVLPANSRARPVLTRRAKDVSLIAGLCRRVGERPGFPNGRDQSLRFGFRKVRKAVAAGLIERRVHLNLCARILTETNLADSVAFVHGERGPGATPEALFQRLNRMGIRPFLFVSNRDRILFATLTSGRNARSPTESRPAILRNLQQFLNSIVILRQPLRSLVRVVDHRYHLIFGPLEE